MEGTNTHQAVKKDPPETAEKLIKQVNRKTRKKFSAEEKIRIVLEGMKREPQRCLRGPAGRNFETQSREEAAYDAQTERKKPGEERLGVD